MTIFDRDEFITLKNEIQDPKEKEEYTYVDYRLNKLFEYIHAFFYRVGILSIRAVKLAESEKGEEPIYGIEIVIKDDNDPLRHFVEKFVKITVRPDLGDEI